MLQKRKYFDILAYEGILNFVNICCFKNIRLLNAFPFNKSYFKQFKNNNNIRLTFNWTKTIR